MFFLATADLPVVAETVQTPLAPCASASLERPLVLAPILRAGLGLLEGIFDLVADAQIAHLGMYRDEATLQPVSPTTPRSRRTSTPPRSSCSTRCSPPATAPPPPSGRSRTRARSTSAFSAW